MTCLCGSNDMAIWLLQRPILCEIDNKLENDKNIISHKLLGAGSGGSFLLITKKDTVINSYKNVIQVKNYEK